MKETKTKKMVGHEPKKKGLMEIEKRGLGQLKCRFSLGTEGVISIREGIGSLGS